ncbi:MAG: hypothetical protein CVU56_23260 [Deltaproteobacteria bacterium HGW-Deltaproteobacteria-14]|nr:MAG: hypothetical protein CVU56_23260 [Deltaproteobacteria bacterium HGW-Deltaproteobacteria-14]
MGRDFAATARTPRAAGRARAFSLPLFSLRASMPRAEACTALHTDRVIHFALHDLIYIFSTGYAAACFLLLGMSR